MPASPLDLIDEYGPEKVVCVSDVRTGMRGVLVIDNTARGMGKGGTRMSPEVTVEEIARLARTMTWKWAAVDLPFGGAKAGLVGDPSRPDKEAQLRAFARALANEVPRDYVFGLDMGLTEEDAAIFVDELHDRGASVGLPAELGGFPYDELGVTGHGVAEATDAALAHLGRETAGARVSIQGFGAVGTAAAHRLEELGACIVAISTSEGVVTDPDGLNIELLLKLRAEIGDRCVLEYGAPVLPLGDELRVAADVLIPAARHDVIDAHLADELPPALIVEGANLPTTPAAQRILADRGITIVPDFIANAGGVVAAAYSMDRRASAFQPSIDAVLTSVSQRLRENTVTVLKAATDSHQTSHEAALTMAQDRVRTAMRLRGWLRKGAP